MYASNLSIPLLGVPVLGLLKKGPLPPQTAVPFSFQPESEIRNLTSASFSTRRPNAPRPVAKS